MAGTGPPRGESVTGVCDDVNWGFLTAYSGTIGNVLKEYAVSHYCAPSQRGGRFTISPVVASRLALMKANSRWNVPDRFLLTERSDAEWVSLRDSLASLRISQQRGLAADSVAQRIVDAAESEPLTSAARQRGQAADELRAAMSIVLGGR